MEWIEEESLIYPETPPCSRSPKRVILYGVPNAYHIPRVSQSTGRYERFVKRMRAEEESARMRAKAEADKSRMQLINDFRCNSDKKSFKKKLERRLNLHFQAYEDDLNEKRERLTVLLTLEEEQNTRLYVTKCQGRAEEAYKNKMEYLAHLLDKRKKEHFDKYKTTPIEKCSHVMPCLFKMRAVEDVEFQKYQIRENKMKKMAKAEVDQMWTDVLMKESDALAARLEVDEIKRVRQATSIQKQLDAQMEQIQQSRKRERERKRRELREMQAKIEEDDRKENEKEQQRRKYHQDMMQETMEMIMEQRETNAKNRAEQKMVNDMWDSLVAQGITEDQGEKNRRKQMEAEMGLCNLKLAEMRQRRMKEKFDSDPMIVKEGLRIENDAIRKDYEALLEDKKQKKINQKYILKQIKDRDENVIENEKAMTRYKYNRQVEAQLDQLVKHKQMTEAQAKKLYGKDLTAQMEYKNLIKERAKKEESEQYKKYLKVTKDYEKTIEEMLSRPFFTDKLHPFMKLNAAGGVKTRLVAVCK